jgi:hypothetical protein
MVGKQAPAGKQGTAVHGSQTWLRPPHSVVEKIEALLELGKSTSAIRNHHTMVSTQCAQSLLCPRVRTQSLPLTRGGATTAG